MKQSLVLLTGFLACIAPCANAQETRGFAPDQSENTRLSSETLTRNINGTVQLNLARPGDSYTDQPVYGVGPENRNSSTLQRSSDPQISLDFNTEWTFAESENSRGLTLSPRFTEYQSNDAGLESYSAEIRLGNVVQFERGTETSGWYVFAAADGEALSLSTNNLSLADGAPMTMSLDDQITVGDLQAGISTYFGGTQFTISYIETEASYSAPGGLSTSQKESFAGISLARSF